MFTLWVFQIYVATFQQHLQVEYTSLSWNDVRLHQDRLHEFCFPLSIPCHEWTLICLVCTDCWSLYSRSPKGEWGILFYLCPAVQDIFRRIFLSNCWWQISDIWSQASYRNTIMWVAFLDPSDSYFLFADFVGFYTHWTYMHIFRHFFLSNYWWQQIDIWSHASYRYSISWEEFLNPSYSFFLFVEERGHHKWALAQGSSCFICFCSWLVTICDIWPLLASAASWMQLLEQDLIYHLEILFLTPVLMGFLLLKI